MVLHVYGDKRPTHKELDVLIVYVLFTHYYGLSNNEIIEKIRKITKFHVTSMTLVGKFRDLIKYKFIKRKMIAHKKYVLQLTLDFRSAMNKVILNSSEQLFNGKQMGKWD